MFHVVNSPLDYKTPSLFIDDNGKKNVNNIFEKLDSEELFEKYVDYELIIRSQNAWFIIEKRAGELYRNILVIDQDGNIYKLKKISQVKTSGLAGTKDNLD